MKTELSKHSIFQHRFVSQCLDFLSYFSTVCTEIKYKLNVTVTFKVILKLKNDLAYTILRICITFIKGIMR